MGAYQLDIKAGLRYQNAQLVVRAPGAEHAEGADERDFAGGGQPGGNPDDVLLGGAKVKKAVGVGIAPKVDKGGHIKVAAEDDQVGKVLGHRQQRAPVGFAGSDQLTGRRLAGRRGAGGGGGHQASSFRAAAYSSAVGARP